MYFNLLGLFTAVAFSDHMGYIVKLSLPDNSSKFLSPKSRPFFKTSPEVVMDNTFKNRLEASLVDWLEIKERGLSVLKWWELVVKPCIRRLAITRTKEIKMQRRRHLTYFF